MASAKQPQHIFCSLWPIFNYQNLHVSDMSNIIQPIVVISRPPYVK